jgi:hypothetical protein
MDLLEIIARLVWGLLQWRIVLCTVVGVALASLIVRIFPAFFDLGAFFVGFAGFIIGFGWNYLASEKRWNVREAKKAAAKSKAGPY